MPKAPPKKSKPERTIATSAAKYASTHRVTKTTRTLVANLAVGGASRAEIAKVMGITLKTLDTYYSYEFEHYRQTLRGAAIQSLSEVALNPRHPNWFQANKALLSAIGGDVFKNTSTVDVNLKVSAAPRIIDPLSLSQEDREALLAITERALEETDLDGGRIDGEDAIDADFVVVEENKPYRPNGVFDQDEVEAGGD